MWKKIKKYFSKKYPCIYCGRKDSRSMPVHQARSPKGWAECDECMAHMDAFAAENGF